MAMEAASSSSIWMKVPPTVGMREANRSTTSVEGVIGYPAEKRAPAASAPSQQAWSPSRKWEPVITPAGSACILYLLWRCRRCSLGHSGFLRWRRLLVAEDGEVGAVHAAQIATAALLRMHQVRSVITLGIEGGGERQNFGGTKLHTETAGLTALYHDLHCTFGHGQPFYDCGRLRKNREPQSRPFSF